MTKRNHWLKLFMLLSVTLLTVASTRAQQTQVFVSAGTSNQLMHFDGSRWTPRGGEGISSPDACSWGPDRIDVVVRGSNNHLWQIARVRGQWSGWNDLGGELTSDPTCVSWGPNRIDLFARGADASLIHKAWDGTRWSEWESLGGQLPEGYSPDAASWGPNRIDVFARNNDNTLLQLAWDGTRWAWYNLGGRIMSGPGAVSWGPNRIDVFAIDENHQLVQKAWDGEAWTEWFEHGGRLEGDPDAVSAGVDRLEVLARGSNGKLTRKRWDGSNWSPWVEINESAGSNLSSPGAVVLRGGRYGGAARGRFRISITGFTVNRETWDDALERDGKRDEVFLVSDAALIRRNGNVTLQRNLRGGVVIGDTNNFSGRRKGGSASDLGGLRSGDPHPQGARLQDRPARYNSSGEPPFIAFEGEIIQGESAGVVIPTIWEWDEPMHVYNRYITFLDPVGPAGEHVVYADLARLVARIMTSPQRADASAYVLGTAELSSREHNIFIGDNIGGQTTIDVSTTGEVAARPIGMTRSGNRYRFVPKIFVLTYEAAMLATGGGGVGSSGSVRVNYRDAEDLKGDYTLFLVVERLADGE